MPRDFKTIVHRKGLLHVETPLGIFNIRVGLTDAKGRKVDAVEMIPSRYVGEPKVLVRGRRFIQCKRAKYRAN